MARHYGGRGATECDAEALDLYAAATLKTPRRPTPELCLIVLVATGTRGRPEGESSGRSLLLPLMDRAICHLERLLAQPATARNRRKRD